MMEDEWDYGEDAPKASESILAEIQVAGRMLYRAKQRIDKLDERLKEAKAQAHQIATKDLPEIMSRGGAMTSEITIELEDGTKKTLILDRNHVSARLSEGQRDQVFRWMKDNGYDHLARHDVVVPFTKGQEKEMESFLEFLKTCKLPIVPGAKQDIHASTYTALCKRLVDENAPIDHKVFGIHVEHRVSIVDHKTKRKTKTRL